MRIEEVTHYFESLTAITRDVRGRVSGRLRVRAWSGRVCATGGRIWAARHAFRVGARRDSGCFASARRRAGRTWRLRRVGFHRLNARWCGLRVHARGYDALLDREPQRSLADHRR